MPKIKASKEDLLMAGRLKEIREELFGMRGQLAAAKFFKLPPPTWNKYELGYVRISRKMIAQLAEKKDVSPLYLLTGRGEKYLKLSKALLVKEAEEGDEYGRVYRIPILDDEIAAGPPRAIEDYPAEDFFPFRARWLHHPKDTFGLKVRGDSMEPEIPNGAWVLVDVKDREPRPSVIYAIRAEGGCVVRRLFINGDVLNFFPLRPSAEN